MFQKAYKIAAGFTRPTIDLWKQFDGTCKSSLAAHVIINADGWIVTAGHVAKQAQRISLSDRSARAWEAAIAAIHADTSISDRERDRRVKAQGTQPGKAVRRGCTMWGQSRTLKDVTIIEDVDLAVGRLDPFDASTVPAYPSFKDPTKNMNCGATLCKLGFPFTEISPTYDEATSSFSLPPQLTSVPLFPIDGLFTRNLNIAPVGKYKFPLTFLETSSPGLKGQSGGPTFDTNGTIWAIQVQTRPLSLGFSPEIKDMGKAHKEHQFLNVGLGVHVETILGLFNDLGIKHTVANY